MRRTINLTTILTISCLALTLTVKGQELAATAQIPPQSSAYDILNNAKQLYANEGPKVALPEFEKALSQFRQDKDKKGEAIALGLIGNCYKKDGDFPKAEDYLQRALTMKRAIHDRIEEGRTLSHLGLLHREMSDYRKAIEYYNSAIAIGRELADRTLEGSARNNLGLVYDDLGQYRQSLEQYDRALDLYRGTNFERGIADTTGNIGGIHLLLGEYAKALGYYEQAREIDERNNLKPNLSVDLQDIGLAYTGLGKLREALDAFDRSIKLASEAGLKKEEADSRKGKGSALLQLGKYNQAREEYQKALLVYESAGLKQELTEGLGDLGNLELRLGDAVSAEKEFRRAVEIARAINHPRGVTTNLIALGDIEWRRKRFNEAANLYRQALTRAIEARDKGAEAGARIQLALTLRSLNQFEQAAKEAQQALEVAQAAEAKLLEADALYAAGDIARARNQPDAALKSFSAGKQISVAANNPEMNWRFDFGRGQALETLQQNDQALAAYRAAAATIEQVRGELSEERFRAGYLEDKYQVYVALVRLMLKLGKPDEAFVYSEKLRARSYLDLVNRGHQAIRSDAQRERETILRNRIRDLQRKIEEETGKPSPERRGDAFDLFSKELADAEHEYETFLDDLLSSDPKLAKTLRLSIPTRDEIQKRLPPDTALIEYVVADDGLEILVLTGAELHGKSVTVRANDLQSKVEFLRDVLLRKDTQEWILPARSLYQALIAPIESEGWLRGIKNVYIVPHSVLHYLPFAVLAHGNSERSTADAALGPRLLIDDYALTSLPAAATLVYAANDPGANKSILAMAPASTRLRYAQRESQNVSTLYPNRNLLLLGPRATESSFKQFADRYDVIHLATHGYLNKMNPLLSGVMLEADSKDDGRLEVHEILGLQLKAKLVTLSACDTALGSGYFSETPAGDDLVGLTRAFLFAGVPTVLASLWEVNDLSAVRFMHSFYGQLGQNEKATALTKAQREMRARGPYRHPYYWAPFVMVGQMK